MDGIVYLQKFNYVIFLLSKEKNTILVKFLERNCTKVRMVIALKKMFSSF